MNLKAYEYKEVSAGGYTGAYASEMKALQGALGTQFLVYALLKGGETESPHTPCDFTVLFPSGLSGLMTVCLSRKAWCPGGCQHAVSTLNPSGMWFGVPLSPDLKRTRGGVMVGPGYKGRKWAENMAAGMTEATRRAAWWDLYKEDSQFRDDKRARQWAEILESLGLPAVEWRIENSPVMEALGLVDQLGC